MAWNYEQTNIWMDERNDENYVPLKCQEYKKNEPAHENMVLIT